MPAKKGVFPVTAYAPDGSLWWQLETHPGTKQSYGGERKLAAWLAHNVKLEETFTMRRLRAAIGDYHGPNDDEQLNRRLRNLRPDGWVVLSYKTDPSLAKEEYRLKATGWHPGLGKRPQHRRISSAMRRNVLERDGRRCVVCGLASGEPYPGEPGTSVTLTAGHRIPEQRGTKVHSIDELQTECARCNEPVRDELPDPHTLAEVRPLVGRLGRHDREQLLKWLVDGRRHRSRLDEAHDRVRTLSPNERETVIAELRLSLRGPKGK